MRISDWSSDVCSSDLIAVGGGRFGVVGVKRIGVAGIRFGVFGRIGSVAGVIVRVFIVVVLGSAGAGLVGARFGARVDRRGGLRVLAVVLRDVRTVGADVADRHRLAGLAVELQLWVEFAEILQLRQRRQFIQALEAEVVEEALGGAEQLRAAGDVAVADDADPLALFQRLDDVLFTATPRTCSISPRVIGWR